MAGKLTDLTALTGANLAVGDLHEVTDVSDTSMAATGTNKSMTTTELVAGLQTNGLVKGPASAADNAIVRYDGITGKLVQSSAVFIDDTTGMTRFGSSGDSSNTQIDPVNIGIIFSYSQTERSFIGLYGCYFNSYGIITWANGNNSQGTRDIGLARGAAGILTVTNASSGGGALEFREQTAPAVPSANCVRLYAEDNGSGKTRLMALFPSGLAQQVAIEP
jgi:hypothetical protein